MQFVVLRKRFNCVWKICCGVKKDGVVILSFTIFCTQSACIFLATMIHLLSHNVIQDHMSKIMGREIILKSPCFCKH